MKMDVNLSLDEIIKISKSRNPDRKKNSNKKQMRISTKSKKSEKKPFINSVKKSNSTSFKSNVRKRKVRSVPIADARLKLSRTQDARLKILQNKNRITKNRSPLVIGKNVSVDARLKIEAHKQNKQRQFEQQKKKHYGITTIGGDGIIERRINANTPDNGIRVEYEDDDINLEYETLRKENWVGKSFLVRRTIMNNDRRKNAMKVSSINDDRMDDDRMDDDELHEDSSSPFYKDMFDGSRSFKEVTRTITNSDYKKPSVSSSRRSYSRKSPVRRSPVQRSPVRRSPVRNYTSFDDNRKTRSSRVSPPLHPSPMVRNSSYHLIVISNLHENVTGEDIKELFEDVGDLVYAKMIRDGVAEVAYKSQRDAMKAVEIYHNRQLDGLPMKCVLVSNHRDSSPRNVPPINTFSPVEPDTHLIKKALFSSH